MSKSLSIAALVLVSVTALLAATGAPTEVVASTGVAGALALAAAAFGRPIVSWIAAGAQYEA